MHGCDRNGSERAGALVRALRFVRSEGDAPSFEDISAIAASLDQGAVSRWEFDGAVLDLLASAKVDREGAGGWLSEMSDEDVAVAFAADDRRAPTVHVVAVLAGVSEGVSETPDYGFLMDATRLDDAARPAIIGGYDLFPVSRMKKAHRDAKILCADRSERAATALWLHLNGAPFEDSDIVLFDGQADFDAIVSLQSAALDAAGVGALLSEGGEAVVGVDLESIIDQDDAQGRIDLLRAAPVDAFVQSHDYGFLLLKRGRDAHAPIYLAKMTGPGAWASFLKSDNRWRGTVTMAEAIRTHTPVPYFGRDVSEDEISEHPWHSLILGDYAPVVPPVDPVRPADGVAESLRYGARLEAETALRGRFLEAFRTAMEAV